MAKVSTSAKCANCGGALSRANSTKPWKHTWTGFKACADIVYFGTEADPDPATES
jgi:hypothetical protein